MVYTLAEAFRKNFLGNSPDWYKTTIIGFLIINPILFQIHPFLAGWVLVLEFIFTLAMALKCYPLQPGGLLAVEAIVLGMATPEMVFLEAERNFPVIMLLMFMVAGIYFLREMLLFTFTKILLGVRSKVLLSLMFSFAAAFLSAFLDALTVTAVIITVAVGFYSVYHKVASGKKFDHDHDPTTDEQIVELHREDLENFRAFLRSLMMHGAVGTALGGVTTLVGEPQNLLIAEVMDWEFLTFFLKMAHISMPVLVVGLLTCIVLEMTGSFGYGAQLTPKVREVLESFDDDMTAKRTKQELSTIIVQGVVALILVIVLAMHMAEPGVVGLLVIVLATAFNGVTEEHRLGHAFEEALPFTALLVVFFAIVAVIHEQHLFSPVIHWVMTFEGKTQEALFYIANGVLSMISDNVFVATVYIGEVAQMFEAGTITRDQFDALAVAINTGTNIPSVATPNGQAAFLFLLTSALAPLIRLSYGRMVIMAVPYTITMSITGLLALWFLGEAIKRPICHLNLAPCYRGGERQTELLIRELARRGWAQRLVIRHGNALAAHCSDVDGLDIREVASNPLAAGLAIRGSAISHSHEARTVYSCLLAKWLYRVPYVLTRRVVAEQSPSALRYFAYRNASRVVAISRAAGAKLLERMPGLSYDVISDAITGFACDEARIAAIRASRPGKILIGNVGALDHSHKGQGTIIEMAHRVATKHPDWHFMLCGDGRDEERFREQIGDLDNVELLGWVDNVGDYLAAFDVFVYPSLHEALGSALLDAMQFGLPIVASEVDGIPEFIEDGVNGRLVEPENADALCGAIEAVLADENELEVIRARNVEKAQGFSATRMADAYETLYREIETPM